MLTALSCLFMCAHLQYTKYPKSRKFTISVSRELYRDTQKCEDFYSTQKDIIRGTAAEILKYFMCYTKQVN